ncbi:hypothetical protein [Candidatus Binatus sp.]|jgi:hypothetical protein|uniref:hypothetical protein n=1 Tax=Candidatus Binatus sp. TaxID=2811406 RepID=UPI003BBFC576
MAASGQMHHRMSAIARVLLAAAVVLTWLIDSPAVGAQVMTATIDPAVYKQIGAIQLRLGKPIDLLGSVIYLRADDVPRLLRSSAFNFGPGCSACVALLSKTPPDYLTPHLRILPEGESPHLPEGGVLVVLEFNRFSDFLAEFRPQRAPAAHNGQEPPNPPTNGRIPEQPSKLKTQQGGCELEHICADPNKREVCATAKCDDLELEVCNSGVQLSRSVSVGPIDITIHGLPQGSSQ